MKGEGRGVGGVSGWLTCRGGVGGDGPVSGGVGSRVADLWRE